VPARRWSTPSEPAWDDRVCGAGDAWDTEWTYGDVIEVVGNAGERLDEIMLPKVQSASEVRRSGPPTHPGGEEGGPPHRPHRIEAQIETARASSNVDEICAASPRLETIHLRTGRLRRQHRDAGADRRASRSRSTPGTTFNYVFSRILMAGRANGLQVIDGPFLKVRGARRAAASTPSCPIAGYDGKMGPDPPDQAGVPQRGLLADPGAVRSGLRHPRCFQQATEGDRKGAVMFGDEMIDEGEPQNGHQVREPRERAGLTRSPADDQPMRRRAMTLKGSVSSAPSKMESTRASTK